MLICTSCIEAHRHSVESIPYTLACVFVILKAIKTHKIKTPTFQTLEIQSIAYITAPCTLQQRCEIIQSLTGLLCLVIIAKLGLDDLRSGTGFIEHQSPSILYTANGKCILQTLDPQAIVSAAECVEEEGTLLLITYQGFPCYCMDRSYSTM